MTDTAASPSRTAGVSALDRRFMGAAIRFARRHLGQTAPNPSVGALVVAEGPDGPRLVGRGVTAIGGRPHAEPQALRQAGEAARGATLYVTLEPCSHHGRTPPCVDAVLAAGIARVVVAVEDPDPRVAGHGIARLRAAGVDVVAGVCAEEARAGLAGHLTRVTTGRPWIQLKLAVSADRRIGRRDTPRLAVTGPEARARVHLMRAEADAILVGIGTALVDDPDLTVRLPGLETASPIRIVLDTHARLPLDGRLAATTADVPVYLLVGDHADLDRRRALTRIGVELLPVPEGPDGRVDLEPALTLLAASGITSVMIEGGAAVADAFAQRDLVDEIALFESDRVIGPEGVALPSSVEAMLADADRFALIDHEVWGADRLTLRRRRDRALAGRT